MSMTHVHPTPTPHAGGMGGAEAWSKKHMLLIAGIGASVVVLFLIMKRGGSSSGSGSSVQYPDQVTPGLPNQPSGVGSIGGIPSGLGDGVGGTQSPSDLFSAFLAGSQYGQSLGKASIASNGMSNALNTFTSSTQAPSPPPSNPAAPPIAPLHTLGVVGTKSIPPTKSLTTPRFASTIKATTTGAEKHGQTRTPQVAHSRIASTRHAVAQVNKETPGLLNRVLGATGTPVHGKNVQPSHTGMHHEVAPVIGHQIMSTGTHPITSAASAPTLRQPVSVGHTIVKRTETSKKGPSGRTIPHMDPIRAISHSPIVTTPYSAGVRTGRTVLHTEQRVLQPVISFANNIINRRSEVQVPGKVEHMSIANIHPVAKTHAPKTKKTTKRKK